MQYHPYLGTYKPFKGKSSNEEMDEYELMSLCIRQGIRPDDLKEMSYVTLINTLISMVEEKEQKATPEEIKNLVGRL